MLQNEINITPRSLEVLYVHIAARRLGCAPRTVRRLIQQQGLPAQRLGQRRWVLFESDVENLRMLREESWFN